MEELSIRPGFNLHAAFRGHLSSVRRIAYNGNTKHFLSMDEHCLKAWTVQRDGSTRVHHDVQFPSYQQNFITSMVLSQELNLLFTSCLDDNLRLYNERLRLKSCMPWSNGVVREMVFYEPRSLLVTAGSYGVKVWECLLDYEAFRMDKTSDLYDVPKIKDGSVLPWCFGKYQHVRLRCTLHVPGARLMGASGPGTHGTSSGAFGGGGRETTSGSVTDSEGGGDGEVINAPWCDRITLHEPTAMLLAMFQGHVYGFDIMNGTCLSSYTSLYSQPVTSCVFVPESDQLYTTAMDTCAVLWRVPRGCDAQRFKQFGRTYAPMTLVLQDPDLKHVLTTSLDGSVTLWDMETLVPVFKMKLSKTPVSTAFFKPNQFFLATDTEVKIFTVSHLFEAWMDCNSAICNLRPVSYGLILAEFADSSVRLLDTNDITRPDKAVVTTMPQLSSQLLVACVVSLTAARLFVLLSDSSVHIWHLHLRRPPSFVAAWTHLTRECGVSLAYLDGGSLSAGVSHRMALPYDHVTRVTRDHLMVGTSSGDCLLLDITSGHISFRFPAFKHQPLQILAPDLDRSILVTVSRNTIKLWNMLEVRCMHELHTSKPVTRLELLEGRAIAGTVSGSVHVMELATGASNAASVTVDHLDAVTGIGPSVFLQHVVTGSKDSHIKVFDRDKRFKRSIYVGAPVSAVSYLNDQGDILAAMGQRLVVIRAEKYDRLSSSPKESIYDEFRGKGRAPRVLLRAMQCRMQRLIRCKVPLQLYAASATEEGGAGPDSTRRHTPPLQRLQTRGVSTNIAVDRLIHGGSTGSGGSGGGVGGGSFERPRSQGTGEYGGGPSGGSAGRPTSQSGSGAAAGAGGGSGSGAAAAGSRPPSSGLRGALRTPESEDQRPGTREGASRGGTRNVQWLAGQGVGAQPGKPAAGSSPTPGSAAKAAPSGGDGGVGLGGDVDGPDGAGVVKSEDEDEGRLIAKEMYPLVYNYNLHKEKMRIDRLIHGLPSIHQRVSRSLQLPVDPIPVRPGSRRSKEGETGPDAAAAAAANAGGAAAAASTTQTPNPLLARLNSIRHGVVEAGDKSDDSATGDGSDGSQEDGTCSSGTASPSHSESEGPGAPPVGLSAAFRRTLPVIASPSAFFDGHMPLEAMPRIKKAAGKKKEEPGAAAEVSIDGSSVAGAVEAAYAEAMEASKAKKKKKKKKKKRRRAPANMDLMEQLKGGLDYEIRAEVKAFEKHQNVQRLATATFLPRLGGAAAGSGAPRSNAAPHMPGTESGAAGGGLETSQHSVSSSTGPGPGGGGGGGTGHLTAAPSFKAMMKGLGVRGNVADIARMLEDPGRFVVAQEQKKHGQERGPGSGGTGTPPAGVGTTAKSGKRVTMVGPESAAGDEGPAGAEPVSGHGTGPGPVVPSEPLSPAMALVRNSVSGAIVAAGDYGLRAVMVRK